MNYIIYDNNYKVLVSSTNKKLIDKILTIYTNKNIDCNCIVMPLKEFNEYIQFFKEIRNV